MPPDPQTSRLISAFLEDAERPDGELTAPDGRVYHKRSAPEPGVRTTLDVTAAGGASERVLTIFEPQTDRPATYPAELPFVPDAVAMVNHALKTRPPAVAVVWSDLVDADAVEQNLVEISRANGWIVTAEPKSFVPGLASPRELRRGGEQRLISRLPAESGTGSHIMLMQT